MKSHDLQKLRDQAYDYLVRQRHPLSTPLVARRLFGARRHEMPETQVVVRALLEADPRFVRSHDGSWTVLGAEHLLRPLDETEFVVVDLETTGSVIGVDEIIEIGAVVVRGGRVLETIETLVWTDRAIPSWVARLTGISNGDLAGAPTFSDVARDLHARLDGRVFVAHDIRFDLPFLSWEFSRRGLSAPAVTGLCTLQLSRQLWPDLASRSLGDLASHFGIVHDTPHRAAADAGATAGVLAEVMDTARSLGLTDLGDLLRVEEILAARGDEDLSACVAES
jgi:DNA polymerase III epsilon subunit family exonuclease